VTVLAVRKKLFWGSVLGARMPRIMGAMEGSNLAVSLSALSQQVSSAEDRRANEALLPRVDDPSLVSLPVAVRLL